MKIAVAGIGYVGLSLAVLLAQRHDVTAVDILPEKAEQINARISPIRDSEIECYMQSKKLRLSATTQSMPAYQNAELIIIATPTNYEDQKGFFDTSSVEETIRQIMIHFTKKRYMALDGCPALDK